MDDVSRFCCQNPRCREHGKRGLGNLYVRARYGKAKSRRLLCCRICDQRFSESKGTPLFGCKLAPEKCLSILEHLSEGCGIRQTARLVKVDRKTVGRLSGKSGGHAKALHDELVAFSPGDPGSADGRKVVVCRRMEGRLPRQMTTGEYPSYAVAIHRTYGRRMVPLEVLPRRPGRPRVEKKFVPAALNYAVVHKHRKDGRVVRVESKVVFGTGK